MEVVDRIYIGDKAHIGLAALEEEPDAYLSISICGLVPGPLESRSHGGTCVRCGASFESYSVVLSAFLVVSPDRDGEVKGVGVGLCAACVPYAIVGDPKFDAVVDRWMQSLFPGGRLVRGFEISKDSGRA
jgi:hypothetical protein